MANYEVLLDPDNSIGTIINLDTWSCFTNDPNNADYQIYEDVLSTGYTPTYMGGDATLPNYPGAKISEPTTTASESTATTTSASGASESTSASTLASDASTSTTSTAGA